jgi:hypothetical protein
VITTTAPHELFQSIAVLERRVLRLLIPNRRLAAPIVAAADLDIGHFRQDDHRIIFASWVAATQQDLGVVSTLQDVRRALRDAGLWDDQTPALAGGMRHSDATLADLGTHRLTEEELDDVVGRGPGDGLRRAIARHVVALIEAANALREVPA